jgi:chromosome segregation ATPase/O6-methylguanine-DNA--protein-cysteine methyltransferase
VSGIKEQQLNERLTAVAGKLQQVTVTMQSKDTVHDAHISELEGAVSQLSAEAAKAQDVKAQLAEMRSELAGAADLQRLKELYSSIDRKSQTLETRLTNDETAEKLVRIKENKDIGNSLSMITAALEDIRAQNLDDKVTGLAGRLAELARGMRDADTATLKQLVDLKGAYNELNANVAFKKEVAERFHDIAKSLATLDSMVASTKQKAAEQRAETETNVKQAIRALDNKLAMMQQEAAATHQKDVSEIEKRAASATRRLDELKRNVEAEDENYLKLAQNVDDIHARTVELVSKLGVGEEEDKRISDEIAHLKSALKRLGDSSVKGADYTQAMARVVTEITKLEQELEAVKAAEGELAQGESVDREQLTLIAGLVRQLDEKTESELVAKMKDSQQSLERADDTKALKKELLEFRKDAEADKTKFKRILHRVTTLEQAVAGGQKSEIKAGIKELGEEVAEHERKLGHRPAQEKLAKSAEKVKEFLARGEGTAAEASELRRQLFSIEHELSTGNPEYQQLAQRVEEIKEKFTKLSAKGAKPPELQSVRKGLTEVLEDLLDLELEKRGLTEALSRVRKANEELASPTPDYKRANAIIKSAHKLLEYERETLNDLRIDLKDAEARFPEVEGILARRERQEEALKKEAEAKPPANEEIDAAYAQFKRSIERMRAAREAIKREEPTGTRAVESPALLRRELRLMDERVPFADTRSLEGAAVGLNEIGESLEGATPAPRVDRAVGMLGDAAVKAKEAQLAAEQKRFESPETRGEMEAREAVLQIAGEKLAEAQEKLEQVRGLPLPPPPRLKVDEEKIVLAAVSRIPLGAFATVQDLARSAGIPSGRVRALLSAGGAGFVFDGTIVERTG